MAKSDRPPEDRRLRRKTAAFRLKHDVGKALRWSAPEAREADAEALRARLANDLLPRAGGGGAGRDVMEIFFEWEKEERALFGADDPDLRAVENAMGLVASGREALVSSARPAPAAAPSPSSPSKKSLSSLSSLAALDDACLEVSRACTAFYRRIAVEDGPEIVRSTLSGVHRRSGRGGGA